MSAAQRGADFDSGAGHDPGAADPAYQDERLAMLYDALNPWGRCDDFYLGYVMRAAAALDVGCGTGALLCRAREAGHRGDLVGLDPAAGMLGIARARRDDITWLRGAAQTLAAGRTFELITMTGHAFQVLLDDESIGGALASFRRHLVPGGRLAFETRNPAARAWQRWTPELTRTTVASPTGESFEVAYDLRAAREPGLIDFVTTCRSQVTGEVITSPSTLRFVSPARLRSLLTSAGFAVEGWFGDWDRSAVSAASPEIIVTATVC